MNSSDDTVPTKLNMSNPDKCPSRCVHSFRNFPSCLFRSNWFVIRILEIKVAYKHKQVNKQIQGGVTPIDSILPPATGVKNFDSQFLVLTLDFA